MRSVVVVESCFGNTVAVAEAIAEGLRSGGEVEVYTADQAPAVLSADLVVIAAPTHNGNLPKPKSRAQAEQKGAIGVPQAGVREWIAALDALDARVFTVSTTTGGRYDGSAGKAAVKALRKRKIVAEHSGDFLVRGRPGPLAEGEADRARAWGVSLTQARVRPQAG